MVVKGELATSVGELTCATNILLKVSLQQILEYRRCYISNTAGAYSNYASSESYTSFLSCKNELLNGQKSCV